ncbi:sterol desaturase family protein [Pelomonas sp. CA6]|uniref:sterol desaturase family protein n=1 Tax=Pelomonas sp. CA6 TaxID=2907999 RepID=UPI001F4BFB52|nr:sterol desaturase family protein [Pelomonas sp. CA6]MCH7344216.1 sterol desaturase family protein [Pelomonas sp. CA6]
MLNPIVLAVPVFLLMIVLEWMLGRARGQTLYRAADTVSSLGNGIASQLTGMFTKLFMLGIYTWIWQRAALFELSASSPWVWLAALLIYDFCYYWNHRLGHTVAVLWAAHAVHHSSEEYNLSTALRQTSTGFLFSWIFYLPMALLGFPPLVYVVVGLIDLLYQFWVHTRAVGRLGWFDRWFCSPSNHRVHHGQNDYCLDRNYGGILMVWDRLFGTFVEEREGEPIVYGVLGQLKSWSPWQANLRGYQQIWSDLRLADNWGDRLSIWFRHPSWRPAAAQRLAPKPAVDLTRFQPYAPPLRPGLERHGLEQLAVLLSLGVALLALQPFLAGAALVLGAVAVLAALVVLSRLLEGRAGDDGGEEQLRLALGLLAGLALAALETLPGLAADAPGWAAPLARAMGVLLALGSLWGWLRLAGALRRPGALT